MKVRDFQELTLSVPNLRAYLSRLNIYKNKDIIFPHEETAKDSHITKDILKNSVIVLGVTFEDINKELVIENKIFILDKSAQHITEINNPNNIITPPIVGVPIFFIIWSSGPSSRIGFKIFWFEKNFINGPPIIKTITKEVNTDNPVLNVKYLKTFRNPKAST